VGRSLSHAEHLTYMVNHGSSICSNIRPFYVDLHQFM
jgi:hypothetical protein